MIKEQDLRKVMENDPETVSGFEREIQGQTHLHSTSECSRGASGLFDAYAVLNYPGGERTVQPTAGTMPTTSAVAFALVCSLATAHKARLPRNSGYHHSLFTWRGKVGFPPTGWRPSPTPTTTRAASTPISQGTQRSS
ncbi:hypothetical protein KAT72_16955 [Aeromonas popoffii]|uniref:Uncharacterized protein n=1 Tax=Aeromonas popoffii TaxID=70856 RepID=A0ABS5GU62_9GAMM|nr:hypothetical protein [Aeromonas popoffii]MBR7630665.1 hypothetical protein [Aeromonas popoffii]